MSCHSYNSNGNFLLVITITFDDDFLCEYYWANVDKNDCCWAIVIGVDGRAGIRESKLGVVGSEVVVWIGICRIIESNGPSTIVDGEDGVLGFSSIDSKACWRNCSGDRSKFVTPVGEGGLVG